MAIVVALMLAASVFVLPSDRVEATSIKQLQNRYNSLVAQQKQVENQIRQNKQNQKDTKAQQTELNQNIQLVKDQVSVLSQKITLLNSQITQKQQQIDSTQQSINDNTELFKQRLRVMYMDGNVSFLEVLLSSKNITDFLTKEEILYNISTHDTSLIQNLHKQQQEVRDDKKALEGDRNDLVSTNNTLAQKKQDLNSKISQSNALLATQKQQASDLNAQKLEIQKEMDKANSEIEALQSVGKYVGGAMLWPLQGVKTTLTSYFKYRRSPTTGYGEFHTGIDITKLGGGTYGYPIHAANSGVIKVAQYSNVSYGNHIVIDHGGGMMTLYGHCCRFADGITVGKKVNKGDIIAYVGSTGNSTGPHLHFSVLMNNRYVNPLNYTYSYENCNNSNTLRHTSPYYKVMP